MKLTVPCSLAQELLISEHLLQGKELFISPDERRGLIAWVGRHYPGHRIASAEIDLENARWNIEVTPVTT